MPYKHPHKCEAVGGRPAPEPLKSMAPLGQALGELPCGRGEFRPVKLWVAVMAADEQQRHVVGAGRSRCLAEQSVGYGVRW